MKQLLRFALCAIPLLWAMCGSKSAVAADRGVVTLWCKGTATDNDDPRGRDESAKSAEKQGKLVIDFDTLKVDFLSWNHIAISEVTYTRIVADRNAFATGSGYHVRIDRTTGNVNFQTLVHDPSNGETWYSHGFSGRCSRADKHGRPLKTKPESAGF